MDIGTHSIRSAAAMAMYLAGVPVFTIMLIGRWSRDAFLHYIRRQSGAPGYPLGFGLHTKVEFYKQHLELLPLVHGMVNESAIAREEIFPSARRITPTADGRTSKDQSFDWSQTESTSASLL
eukprot:scaffold62029_cov65-Attheya_sp.AAC.1